MTFDKREQNYTFEQFQRDTQKTAMYPRHRGIYYTTLGLAGEAGEVANKVKKIIRDDGDVLTSKRKEDLKQEIGDVLWYVSQLCSELELDMADVALSNISKLANRKEKDKIQGEGDNR